MTRWDPAFENAGKIPGMEIWRIEKMRVVPVEEKSYGKFHTGDSYIVLNTKKGKYGSEWNIHFWLGTETTQDEAGAAAFKTVELDDSLGGAPVQHREVQNHESKQFISYFPNGIQYLAGGVESGFKKVEKDKYEPRLLHVKGRRNIRVQQTRLAWNSMNSGDVFILDLGLTLYVWNGKESGRLEKIKGLDVARRIRDEERGGRAALEVVDEDANQPITFKFIRKMNQIAEGSPSDIQLPTDDVLYERKSRDLVKLYQVSDESGSLTITEVGGYPLKRELLDSKDAFILDTGAGGIFAWLGSGATRQEKKAAFKNAVDFIEQKGYPHWTNVTCVHEGAETPLFKQNFSNWLNKYETTTPVTPKFKAGEPIPKFDVKKMHEKGSRRSKSSVDDGSGKVDVWRIEHFDTVPVEEELHGQFFAGDSYVILYTYYVGRKECYVVYFWQGQESSVDEKATSALKAVELDDKLGGLPVQVRVVQNKEPDHFLMIFKGKMVVHTGGHASGFKNCINHNGFNHELDDTKLYHVRGTNEFDTRAVQVEAKAASLNSNDCFVLLTSLDTYIWYGKGCSGDERQLAADIMEVICPSQNPIRILEGRETKEFWNVLGGKTEYGSGKWLQEIVPSYPPRLFQCSNASGRFMVEEIFDFAQEDLVEEDVMILDTFSEVFVWIGRGANEVEKKEALTTACEYIETDPSNRDVDSTLLIQVKQGCEPPTFTCHFLGWNPNLWAQDKSYEAYRKQVDKGVTAVADELKKYDDSRKFKYIELKGRNNCPTGVDVTRKESYLTDEEFQKVFGKSVSEFKALPEWKKKDLKKKVDLF